MDSRGQIEISKPFLEVYAHKIYLTILEQIERGNKTSTSIARELNMAQSGIYERLKKMKKIGLLKSDEKNFIINYNFLATYIIMQLPKSFVTGFKTEKELLQKTITTIKKELLNKKSKHWNIGFFLSHIQTEL
jgi:predicted transcriptional regulator